MLARASSCLAGVLIFGAAAWAQNISCSLSGTVQDMSGAVFPNVDITLVSAQNGFSRKGQTDASGYFSFPDLTSSTYSLEIAAPGFRRYSQSGIQVAAGERRVLPAIHLKPGEVSETVEVTADASRVKLSSGERSASMTGSELNDLAIRGRDLMDAVALMPGVVDTSDGREVASSQSMTNIYIVGGRSNQKNMTVDGISNLDTGSNNSVQTMPSLSSIAEVQVLMSNYSAEYGRNSGGSITVITRGGGRQFHGSAAWYHRHEQFTANDFFNNSLGRPRSRYRYNIFDYSFSGPVFIPGVFNRDRSKLFFFFSQEFQEQLYNYGQMKIRVPTAAERLGDFSQTLDVNGKPIAIHDPLNGGKTFVGNIVPPDRFSRTGQNILKLLPVPNFTDPNPSLRNQWNYLSDPSAPRPRHSEVARIDYSPRANLQLYARYSKYTEHEVSPYGASANWNYTPVVQLQPGFAGTLHASATLSPSLFGEFIFGISQRKHDDYLQNASSLTRAATGIDVPLFGGGRAPDNVIPSFSFGGITNGANLTLSNRLPWYVSNTIFSWVANLTRVQGKHTFKTGVYIERTRKDQSADTNIRGTIAFDRDSNNPLDTNFAFASALLGYYTDFTQSNARPQGFYRFTNLEAYVQDNWRIRPGLTLDVGVRFYHDPPQVDQRGQIATFVPSLFDPAQAPVLLRPGLDGNGKRVAVDPLSGAVYSQGLIGTYAPGRGNVLDGIAAGGKNGFPASLYTLPFLNIAPRVGFAWDPFGHGRTAIRGGAGVFYDRIAGQITMDTLANPPAVLSPAIYSGTLESLFDTSFNNVQAPPALKSLFGSQQPPTVYNYSLSYQQQIGRKTLIDVSYVGSLARHLLWARNINPVPARANHLDVHPENTDLTAKKVLPSNFLRPYQGFGDIFVDEFGATSNYNSAQVAFTRRMTTGFRLGASYTFSKTLGTAAADDTKVSALFPPRSRNYGPLPYDRTHVASIWYNYSFPKPGRRWHPRLAATLARNWELSGITRMVSGAPFTPGISTTDSQDITGTSSEGPRIDVVNPGAVNPVNIFGRTPRGSFGNAGSGILRGPGTNNWDISLYRRIQLRERVSAQLRIESYNTFNHTQFASLHTTAKYDPSGAQVDPLFLQPASARGPRRIQLALRLNW